MGIFTATGYVGLRVSAPYALQTSNYPTQPAGAYAQPNPPGMF